MTRLFLIPDLHHTLSKGCRNSSYSSPSSALKHFKSTPELLACTGSDYLVFLGDMLTGENMQQDIDNLQEVLLAARACQAKCFFAIGNHELYNMKKEQVLNVLETERYYSIESDHARILVLDTMHEGYVLRVDDEQLVWLQGQVLTSTKPLLVLSHAPLYQYDYSKNKWFKDRPGRAFIENYEEVSRILHSCNHKVVCISGHVHENSFVDDGRVACITLQSFAENLLAQSDGEACKAFAQVDLDCKFIMVKVNNDDFEYGCRW